MSCPDRQAQPTPGRPFPEDRISAMANGNAAELYGRISADSELTQSLFRQALQDPAGALQRIVEIGAAEGLPVTVEEVQGHLGTLDDSATRQWLVKARGGL